MAAVPALESRPLVSIVVIVQDDEALLHTAVESAVAQSYGAVEVLVVNHGSEDGTGAVADRFAKRYAAVRAIHLDTREGGPGRPLNAGIDRATGDYVTFMGSDDVLEPDAVRAMVAAAEVHRADVVLGRTDRVHVDEGGRRQSWFHSISNKPGVWDDLGDRPGLMWDTISAAKLYRRALLDRHGLRFPEGVVYEDQLFTAQVYTHATRIAVVPDLLYNWMVRKKTGRPSLTNTRNELKNLHDRLYVNRAIDGFFEARGRHDLAAEKHKKFVSHDLKLYLDDLPHRSEEYKEEAAKLLADYLAVGPAEGRAHRDAAIGAQVHLIRRGELSLALDVHRSRASVGILPPTSTVTAGRLYVRAPESDDDLRWLSLMELEGGPESVPYEAAARVLHASVGGGSVLLRGDVRLLADVEVERVWLLIRHRHTERTTRLPVEVRQRDGVELSWTARFGEDDLPWNRARTQPFDFLLEFQGAHGHPDARLVVDPRVLADVDELRVTPPLWPLSGTALELYSTERRATFSARLRQRMPLLAAAGDIAKRLPVRRALRWLSPRRKALIAWMARRLFALARKLPRADVVVFESFQGRAYSDSPKAISERLAELRPDLPQVWSFAGRAGADLPPDLRQVHRGSLTYYWVMGRARFWVDNFGHPAWMVPGRRTTYLQTWHGVPLKRMFFDAPVVKSMDGARKSAYQRMVDSWTYLVANSRYFEDSFGLSANFRGDYLRCGMPRNDRLVREAEGARDELHRRMGVPADRRVLLYAPTYRPPGLEQPRLPLETLAERFGEGVFLLVRQHYYKKAVVIPPELRWFAKDISDVPDVNDAMLAADALITDYSSLMFDFALLRRPMLWYVPDWSGYARIVGGYFSPLQGMPGPVALDERELFEGIGTILRCGTAPWGQAYDAFVERYAGREDGRATDHVIREVFGTG